MEAQARGHQCPPADTETFHSVGSGSASCCMAPMMLVMILTQVPGKTTLQEELAGLMYCKLHCCLDDAEVIHDLVSTRMALPAFILQPLWEQAFCACWPAAQYAAGLLRVPYSTQGCPCHGCAIQDHPVSRAAALCTSRRQAVYSRP